MKMMIRILSQKNEAHTTKCYIMMDGKNIFSRSEIKENP